MFVQRPRTEVSQEAAAVDSVQNRPTVPVEEEAQVAVPFPRLLDPADPQLRMPSSSRRVSEILETSSIYGRSGLRSAFRSSSRVGGC